MPGNAPQGIATFPGIGQIVSAVYTLSHGLAPGRAQVEMAPQSDLTLPGGILSFLWDGQPVASFYDCRVVRHTIRTDTRGRIWSLEIEDRRWRWPLGEISGYYNVRQDDQSINPLTEKTPQQLASLCLLAMQETGFDVSQLPNDSRPAIEWEAENPAQALDQLIAPLGCRIVLRLDNTVMIALAGVGQELPSGGVPVMDHSLGLTLPERPDMLTVVCGHNRYQANLLLEPVGRDVDGSIKPIDQLSYTPAGGWIISAINLFANVSNVPDPITQIRPRDLAQQTVYKWWRITAKNAHAPNLPLTIPGYDKPIQHIGQLLPIEDVLCQVAKNPFKDRDDLVPVYQPAVVIGAFYDWNAQWINIGDPNFDQPGGGAPVRYPKAFSIDKDTGIVKFSEAMVNTKPRADGGVDLVGAKMFLRCAVPIADPQTLEYQRYRKTFTYPGQQWGTPARILKHDDLVLSTFPDYDALGQAILAGLHDNKADINTGCDYYIRGADQEYQLTAPYDYQYAALLPINPDGAIQQVTWSVGLSGATTRASRGFEYHPAIPSYRERKTWALLQSDKFDLAVAFNNLALARRLNLL